VKNASYKVIEKTKTHILFLMILFASKLVQFNNVEKYGRARGSR
jgi:hypothetical protein